MKNQIALALVVISFSLGAIGCSSEPAPIPSDQPVKVYVEKKTAEKTAELDCVTDTGLQSKEKASNTEYCTN